MFRKVIGISIEANLASIFANLVLYYNGSKWIKKKKTDTKRARIFPNTLRFVDDLIHLNFGIEFERSFLRIYLQKLKCRTTEGFFKVWVLKLEVTGFP